jgi:hypothetical protein
MKTTEIEARARRLKASRANGRKWGGLSKTDAVQAWKDGFHHSRTADRRKLVRYIAAHGAYKRGGNVGDAAWIEREVLAVIEKWYRETR